MSDTESYLEKVIRNGGESDDFSIWHEIEVTYKDGRGIAVCRAWWWNDTEHVWRKMFDLFDDTEDAREAMEEAVEYVLNASFEETAGYYGVDEPYH